MIDFERLLLAFKMTLGLLALMAFLIGGLVGTAVLVATGHYVIAAIVGLVWLTLLVYMMES